MFTGGDMSLHGTHSFGFSAANKTLSWQDNKACLCHVVRVENRERLEKVSS